MDEFKKKLITSAVVSALMFPGLSFATNGMQSIGNGAKSRGMGGVGVALANENAAIVTNPAAVVDVGNRLDISVTLFKPSPRTYEITGNDVTDKLTTLNIGNFNIKQKSKNDLFFIPGFGMTFPVDKKSSFAFGMAAAGGMNTEYKTNFGNKIVFKPRLTKKTGINVEQLYVTGTYGRKLNKDTSVGLTALYAFQTLEVTGLTTFGNLQASEDKTKLSNTGKDTSSGVGYKIGVQTGFSNIRFGIAYQPKIKMSKFNKYSGLLANQGEFDIPPSLTAGIAIKFGTKITVALDYQNIDYESVPSISNSLSKFTKENKLFGSTDGPGFGWKSIDIFKLGFEYVYNHDWTLRVGYNKGESPVVKEELSVAFLAPAITTDHYTVGFTNRISDSSEYTVNIVRATKNRISGEFVEKFGGGMITVEMEQISVEASYSKKF